MLLLKNLHDLLKRTLIPFQEGSKLLDSREPTAVSEEPDDYFDKYGITGEEGEDAEEWEREASKLYEWTQELSFNDDLIATPRLPIQI